MDLSAHEHKNPFRPGAGHMPPYLAGREEERAEFAKLLRQDVVLENPILTGLRGVGKTVLRETFKPLAQRAGWLWVGSDLSESASVTESSLATRLLTDLSIVSSSFAVIIEHDTWVENQDLDYDALFDRCNQCPGLMSDKLKAVLELAAEYMPSKYKGIIFAYDEAQKLVDRAEKDEYPLSVLLEVFQSLQKKGLPFMLFLTGLPTLFPRLVESRTYAERMFRVLFLDRLSKTESEEAISKPMESSPIQFSGESVQTIIIRSGGYPYFIQFICREVYDVFLQQLEKGDRPLVSMPQILKKLDSDFFAGRWAKTTDRQRDLLWIVSSLPNAGDEFTAQEIVSESKSHNDIKKFSSSHTNQILSQLADAGLVYKNRRGRYSFAVPLLDEFIQRQELY